ncbi:MAG: acyltransferase [Verrucomicrobiota bacterium]
MRSSEPNARTLPRHFYSLDALRGIAALAVVFYHWQHFFSRRTELPPFAATQQPLYFLFKPLYTDGWRAVDLFFCLSGFIFFWLYNEKIARRETSAKQFSVLRISRLYPLHFLTLLVVAAGQQFMLWRDGSSFVYSHNDLFHFALQTTFASNWGFEQGYSFNGPIWSVSVEILCYVLFFLVCFLRLSRWWLLCGFVCCGYYLWSIGLPHIGRGLFSFFIGGLSFQIFGYLARCNPPRIALRCLGVASCLLWVLVPLNVYQNLFYRIYKAYFWTESLRVFGKDVGGAILLMLAPLSFELILFPATIITLALWELHRGTLGRRLAFLGHISYSSYLLHFPLQLIFIGSTTLLSIQSGFFYTPFSLLLFFTVLIPLSLCSYWYFERPCQSLIRGWAFRNPVLERNAPNHAQQRAGSAVTACASPPSPPTQAAPTPPVAEP